MFNDVCICIPSQRKPPLKCFDFTIMGSAKGVYSFLISDPSVYDEHVGYYQSSNVHVVRGRSGMGPQSAECYRYARLFGFKWYFRLDDDVTPGMFIHMAGHRPDLPEVIEAARHAANELPDVSLIGFQNTSNRHWMKPGFSRSYSLVHGGANLVQSDANINLQELSSLARGEDTYKTCAHKELSPDNRIGRVGYIGFSQDKFNYEGTSIKITQEELDRSIEFLKKRFPNQVRYTGEKVQKSDGLIFERKTWVR